MKNLLYKEFGLAVHPLYLVAPIAFGALAMIPKWIYMLIPLYFCFVSVPNLLAQYRSSKDNEFSALLPVPRHAIVTARILTFVILELAHVAAVSIFALIHNIVYASPNFSLQLNASYIGVVLLMYGVFNLILFPLYFRTAWKIGLPVIVSTAVAIAIGAVAEILAMTNAEFRAFFTQAPRVQATFTLAGLAIFAASTWVANRLSIREFERVEL